MAFVKQTLSPFSTRAADPLFEFEEPYIQYGVISGQIYTANQVSYGLPKPSYLQIADSSNTITVVGSADTPIRMVFALGIHDANTGGEVGAFRSFTGKSASNSSVTVSVNGSAWVYAEINENGEPNNLNAWTIDYGSESSVGRTYTTSRTEPAGPTNGDVWFDVINNKLFKYNTDSASWEYKKRVYLGEAGVGDNGYLYTIQSWYPNRGYADYEDSNYLYYENPWRHYDGVSFTTNGQYTAIEAANWANNATIGQAVAGNQRAMNAIANSANAMENIVLAANTTNAIANSLVAIQALEANTSAIGYIVNSAIATESLVSNTTNFAYIANSSGYISAYANSSGGGLEFIANSAIAQGLIVAGSQNVNFSTSIANNVAGLAKLKVGSAGNILYELIGTTTHYNTLVANAQGQLLSLQNAISGPILAIGGNTVAEISDGGVCYRVHTFTGTGAFNVCATGETCKLDVFLIGGGGGGVAPDDGSGGGGGGALRDTEFKIAPGPGTSVSCTFSIGGGGNAFCRGANTTFAGLVAWGGGGGAQQPEGISPTLGGSTGGTTRTPFGNPACPNNVALQPTQPQPACASPLLVQFGCNHTGIAANGTFSTPRGGAGIGGSGCLSSPDASISRKGGIGCQIGITGTNVYYGGGGGSTAGGTCPAAGPAILYGLGGLGGGGMGFEGCLGGLCPTPFCGTSAPPACFDSERGAPLVGCPAPSLETLQNGLANRGGGGGGALHGSSPPWPSVGSGCGGSGVGIVRYRIKQ